MVGEDLVLGAFAFIAGVLLVVGLIQAFRTSPRRRLGGGRVRGGARVQVRRSGALAPSALRRPAPDAAVAAPVPKPVRVQRPRREVAPPAPEPAVAPQAEVSISPAPPVLEPEVSLVEECLALYRAERYEELISAAEPALQRARDRVGSSERAGELAQLLSLVGLAKQALNDAGGALAAFEEAIHAAPERDRSTYERHLAALASGVAHQLLARAGTLGEAAEERLKTLRQAVLWLRQGLAAAPGDESLKASLDRARTGLWAAYAGLANLLVQRLAFPAARRLVLEALAEEELPAEQSEAFKELLSTTYTGEIGQLIANATGTLADEQGREALASLERAEGLLSSIADDALTPRRREDTRRRLWWGYAKLGLRRLEAGEFENALEPLFLALKIGPADRERQQDTRQALVRALEAVADSRTGVIGQLLKAGKREAALAEGERLLALIQEGMGAGLSQEEVTGALTRARSLLEQPG